MFLTNHLETTRYGGGGPGAPTHSDVSISSCLYELSGGLAVSGEACPSLRFAETRNSRSTFRLLWHQAAAAAAKGPAALARRIAVRRQREPRQQQAKQQQQQQASSLRGLPGPVE